jgi:hypothetical protein
VNTDAHDATQRNTSAVHRSSAQATALPRPGSMTRADLHLPPLTEMAKREVPSEPGQLAPLAKANLEKPLAMLQENPLVGLVMRPAPTEMAK